MFRLRPKLEFKLNGAISDVQFKPFFTLHAVFRTHDFLYRYRVSRLGTREPKMYMQKKVFNEIREAGREAAAMPPSRSDRWQANFFQKVRAVRFRLRSAAALATSAKREVPRANGRAAAGSSAVLLHCIIFFTVRIYGTLALQAHLQKPPFKL